MNAKQKNSHNKAYIVYIVCGDFGEAEIIGQSLVREKLAACANIFPQMSSIFFWEGKLEQASEVAMIVKTNAAHVDELIERTKELHSYECPGVVAWPLEKGNHAFFDWIDEEVGKKPLGS